ncbi:MAG: prolyl oligopeptidase family serine peptidase, partial [Terriglobales bacterium]
GKELWDPNPQLKSMALGEASVFRWRDTSGHRWVAGLLKPPNYSTGERYPLVIQTHGFTPTEFITDGSYTTAFAARPLAACGIVVLQTEDNNTHIATARESTDQLMGYASAIKELDGLGLIDPKRVGIIGFSRTGYYVEAALVEKPQLFAAASFADGSQESYLQALFWDVTATEASHIYSAPPYGAGLQEWTRRAPGFRLNRVRAPVIMTMIGPTSLIFGWEMYASLQLQKKAVDLVYIPEGRHVLQKPLERLASQQTTVDWFRFWLQGYEDPASTKGEQYRRWERLCDLQIKNNPDRPVFCVRSKTY